VDDTAERLTQGLADRYRIDRAIGAGGMAMVYLAWDLRHQRPVAVKLLRQDVAAAVGAQRFLREIEIAAQLQHPHILPLLDSGEVDGLLYYVMPYIDGESLRQKLLREGALPIAEAARLLSEVSDALAKAHKAGIVHRDIKPENILLSDGHALLMDFGVARAVSDASHHTALTQAGMAVGTPAYMAPEQAAADPKVDARADIYALGVVGYEMLTGNPPFATGTAQQILAAQITATPVTIAAHRATVPAPLAAVLMQCLAKHPADRPQHISELLPALENATHTWPTPSAATASPLYPPAMRRAVVVLCLVAAVVLSAVALLFTHHRGSAVGVVSQSDTIAVLRFRNFAGDTSHAHYGDGVSQEIGVGLAQVGPTLVVVGSTSSFKINLDTIDLRAAATRLGANVILLGTMRWESDSVYVTAELHDRSDHLVWGQQYAQPSGSLTQIENTIARAIVDSLRLHLAAGQTTLVARSTANPEAHRLKLQGDALLLNTDSASLAMAADRFGAAVGLDSGYAAAWAGLATAYGSLGDTYRAPLEMLPLIQRAVHRAVALDTASAQAYLTLAGTYQSDWNFDRARAAFAIARRLAPEASALHSNYASFLLTADANATAALREYRRAAELDPLNPWTVWGESVSAGAAHDTAADMAYSRQLLALDPNFYYGGDPLANAYTRAGRWADCIERYHTLPDATQRQPIARLAVCLAHTADSAGARAILGQLQAQSGSKYVNAVNIARVAAALGDKELAITMLQRAYDQHAGDLLVLGWEPTFAALRRDPRVVKLEQQIGFPWARR
jgi:serine/threonine protein kinase/Tfp pilus assembly protein PilF